ncbi:hypothetical protein ACQ4PT_068365 [Festuca glaucescens]
MAAACGGLARLLAAAALCVLWAALVDARSPAARVHRHLKRLNKLAVKSIELRPAYHPEGLYDDAKSSLASDYGGEKPMLQLWHQNGSASMIEWGGEVVNSEPDAAHTLTQMGSGKKFPEEGFGKACYFKNIQVVDITN